MRETVGGLVLALRAVYETLGISAPTVVDSLLARVDRARNDARLAGWGQRLVAQAEIDLTVSGLSHVTPGRACVLMSNHQSHYDVPILFSLWPGPLRMVAKRELFKIPVFGDALRASGFVEVDRGDRTQAIASLRAAEEKLAEGISIWIAPEGTRSRTGELMPFKKGGFVMALDAGLPILPIAIAGSRDVLLAEGRVVHRGARVHVAVQPVIPVPARPENREEFVAARDRLMGEVRASIERGLREAREVIAQPRASR